MDENKSELLNEIRIASDKAMRMVDYYEPLLLKASLTSEPPEAADPSEMFKDPLDYLSKVYRYVAWTKSILSTVEPPENLKCFDTLLFANMAVFHALKEDSGKDV